MRVKLTIATVQGMARQLSNNCWVRWWAHWNNPQNPAQMAISAMEEDGKTVEVRDLERHGFEKVVNDRGFIIYVCDRVDEDGQPYYSKL